MNAEAINQRKIHTRRYPPPGKTLLQFNRYAHARLTYLLPDILKIPSQLGIQSLHHMLQRLGHVFARALAHMQDRLHMSDITATTLD